MNAHEKTPLLLGFAPRGETLQNRGMGGTGVEHPRQNTENSTVCTQGGAESGALDAKNTQIDPELEAVIESWPKLPEAMKAGILAMIRASG